MPSNHVIPPNDKSEFKHKCRALLTAELDIFLETVTYIQQKWPNTVNWLSWWLIPENAQMIFKALQVMTPELAAKLPETTNAEESMHAIINHFVKIHFGMAFMD